MGFIAYLSESEYLYLSMQKMPRYCSSNSSRHMNEKNQTNFIIERDKNNTELSAQNITSSLSYELNQYEGSQNNVNLSLSNISQLNFNDSSEMNLHQEQKLLNDT